MNIYEKIAALMPAFGMSTMKEVAEAVRRAGAPKVKYQHIQQLREFPQRQPRYLVELASVFNMTVEQFLSWTPGRPIPERAAAVTPSSIEAPAMSYGDEWADVRGFAQSAGLGNGEEAAGGRSVLICSAVFRQRAAPHVHQSNAGY